jgi:hypothetical protein
MAHPGWARISDRYSRTVCQVVFRFALDVAMAALTGTTLHLRPNEVEQIGRLAAP